LYRNLPFYHFGNEKSFYDLEIIAFFQLQIVKTRLCGSIESKNVTVMAIVGLDTNYSQSDSGLQS
jgi:hypothetical protein